MEDINITILKNKDLDFIGKKIDVNNVEEIVSQMLKEEHHMTLFIKSTFVVYFDDNGDLAILKNRYAPNSEETSALLKFVTTLNKKNYDN